jgi:ssDNA-binding Zn-finger/Zn-ribbon topoisomerase 1
MFFFIGGIQPKTVIIEETPRLCPSCGLAEARLKRIDHYLSLFFIPLFPVKRGQPMLICDRCGSVADPRQAVARQTGAPASAVQCPNCGRPTEPSFNYCPRCGSRV